MPPTLGRSGTSARARESAPTEMAGTNPRAPRWTKLRSVAFIDFARLHDSEGLRMLLHVAPISCVPKLKTGGTGRSKNSRQARKSKMAIPTIRRNFPHPSRHTACRRGHNRIRGTPTHAVDIRFADLCFRNQRSARQCTIYCGSIYRFPDPEIYAQGGGEANGGICRLDMVGPLVGGFAGSEPSGC